MGPYARVIFTVVLVAGCSTDPAIDGTARSADKQALSTSAAQVTARFHTFIEAFQAANADVLAAMLTDDYVHTGPTGIVSNKTEWLNWIGSRRAEIEAGTFSYDTYEIEDLSVRVSGDTAIITGLNKAAGTRSGEPFSFQIQFTNVWIRQSGVWLRTAFHDSRLVPE